MTLFSLIEKISHAHSELIISNCRNGNKHENVRLKEDDKKTKKLIQRYGNKMFIDNISMEKFIEGITKVNETKNELWKTNGEILWVQQIGLNDENIFLPIIYDLLENILKCVERNSRQKYFHQLIKYYYKTLKEYLNNSNIILENILPIVYFEENIDRFLPCVKLDLLKNLLEDYNESMEKTVRNLAEEVVEFILCPDILREDCYKIIEKLHCTDCESFTFEFTPIHQQFGNLGHYSKLKLFAKYGDELKTFEFFAKSLPVDNEIVRNLALLSIKKEEFFYSTYMSKVKELGFGKLVDFAPEVYFVRTNNILVLEDLTSEGYRPLDIRDSWTYEILTAGLQNLAKLHASSILIEEHMRTITGKFYRFDEEYGEYLKETLIFKDNPIVDLTSKYAYEYFPSKFQEDLNGMNLQEFQNKVSVMYESMYKHVLKSSKYRNVINHGDAWAGNFLYRMVPNQMSCRLIDFQILRYAPPLVDVLTFLYTHTEKQFRDVHLKGLLCFYRKTLGDILEEFNVEIDSIYDEYTFNQCFEDLKQPCIMLGMFYNVLVSVPPEISPYRTGDNVKKMEFIFGDRTEIYEAGLNCDIFKTRMKGFVEDICECLK